MTDSPKPTPGWYPDPDMVDTVRYWDGNDWTEQRAPSQQPQSTGTPHIAAPPGPNEKRSHKKAIVWAVVAVVVVGAVLLGISLKKGMDNTVANGVATADALTVDDQEITAAGEAMDSTNGESVLGTAACGATAATSAEGLWKGALVDAQRESGSVLFTFADDCTLQAGNTTSGEWLQSGTDVTFSFGAWECTGTVNTDATSIEGYCSGPTQQNGDALRGKGTLTRVG